VWTSWAHIWLAWFCSLENRVWQIGWVIWILSCSTVWRVYRFWGYRSHGFRSLSMYFSIDYYCFRNYRNISVVFISDNIVSISISRKKCENESDLTFYRSFPIVFIPNKDAPKATWSVLLDHEVRTRVIRHPQHVCTRCLGPKWAMAPLIQSFK
jgi:hypothetical protein